MIHPSAYIDPTARIGRDVSIGPNCFVQEGAELGDGCVLHHNVTIGPRTRCGRNNIFFPSALIGLPPQDLKYKGDPTRTEIGDDNVFREFTTVHAGTEVGGGVTRIGSHNRFLVGAHVAHDCLIGDDCVLSNQVHLAGHVHLEDKVGIGGVVGVHHFVTIGTMAYVAGVCRVITDVPPFTIAEGIPAQVRGFNKEGLRRWGLTEEQIQPVRDAYRVLFAARAERAGTSMASRIESLAEVVATNSHVKHLCGFVSRCMTEGVYGRQLEIHRRDTDEDRRPFYGKQAAGAEGRA
jgi:UDP-N-acetylglucosamine acyltransferase